MKSRRFEIRLTDETAVALDETGVPLKTVKKEVKSYGKGGVIYLPSDWVESEVVIIKVPRNEK